MDPPHKRQKSYLQRTEHTTNEQTDTIRTWAMVLPEKTTRINILMQNVRGVPQGGNNLAKESKIKEIVREKEIDLFAIIETGIYDKKKPTIPL